MSTVTETTAKPSVSSEWHELAKLVFLDSTYSDHRKLFLATAVLLLLITLLFFG